MSYLFDSGQRGGMLWIGYVHQTIVVRHAANISVVSIDHYQARLTQRFGMAGSAEGTRHVQRRPLGVAKIELCEPLSVAEADQLRSVIQIPHKVECSRSLNRNRSRCFDLCGIRDVENRKSRAILLFNVEICLAIRG